MSDGMFFSQAEMAEMSSGVCPPAPKDYKLPTAFPSLARAKRISFDWETFDPKLRELGNGVYRKDGRIVSGAIAAWDADGKLFHCVAPWTRVLTAKLEWKAAKDLVVGEALIGFDENAKGKGTKRKYKESIVVSSTTIVQPCISLKTDSETIICSRDHRWLIKQNNGCRWIEAKDILPGQTIGKLCNVWAEEHDEATGYLRGFFDGEATLERTKVTFAQNKGPVLDHVLMLLASKGFTVGDETGHCRSEKVKLYRVGNFIGDRLEFIGRISPLRLRTKARKLWDGFSIGAGKQNSFAKVISATDIGEHPVVALGTSTKTFIAEGLLSHNCEYYPIAHRGVENCDREHVYSYFRDNLNYFEGELIGTNLLYDGDWMQSDGVGITPLFAKWRDVQWAEALLDEMAYTYKLESLGKKYLGTGKVTSTLKQLYGPDYITRFHEVHPGHAREYGLGDVLLPKQILDLQYRELDKLGMMDLFKLESRLTPFLLYLRKQGVRVDGKRAAEASDKFAEKRDKCLAMASKASGVELNAENFGMPRLLQHMFDKLGIKYPKAAKGGPSITDKWLHGLCSCKKPDPKEPGKMIDDPYCGHIGRSLEAANKFDKAKSVFIDSFIGEYAVNGRIHCDFHPLRKVDDDQEVGTESGRFSCGNPNLQQIPIRDEEIGPECRSEYLPEESAEWWAFDYSQIEYRFLVHYATLLPPIKGESEAAVRRRKAIEAANGIKAMYEKDPKTDFHDAVVALTGLKRKDAKNFNFRLVYGGQKKGAAQVLGMLDAEGKPTAEFNAIWDTYHGKAPFIKEMLDLNSKIANDSGEIRTILNRRSQFEFYEPAGKFAQRKPGLPLVQAIEAYGFDIVRAETHKATNRKLQGSAADLFKTAMANAWESGIFTSTTDFTCSLIVHDEADGSIFPTKRGQECHRELQHMMRNAIQLNVPVLTSGNVGANWADAK